MAAGDSTLLLGFLLSYVAHAESCQTRKIKMGSWKPAVSPWYSVRISNFRALSIFVSPYAPLSTGAEQSLGYGKHGKHLSGSEVHTAPITHPGAEIALGDKSWVQWQTSPH